MGIRRLKKPTVAKLKKELDILVSKFVRYSSVIGEYGKCYTCGLVRPKMELQCGHFISRQYNGTRYDLDNLRTQCVNCNVWRRGNIAFFSANLLEELGKERFDALIKRGRTLKQFFVPELTEKIEEYKKMLKEIGI